MKIRNGFVSNSSSSSFVVNAKSTMEAFKKMIPLVQNEYCSYPEGKAGWKKYHENAVKMFEHFHDNNFNDGIIIPFTCNFETYIYPSVDGKCYIETCNNHPWEEVFEDICYEHEECRHYSDDKTKFINVSTGKRYTPKGFSDELHEELMRRVEERESEKKKKEDVSCGFNIALCMTNDECDRLNTRLEEEGYNLEDYRACTKFLLEQAGIELTPDNKVGKNKLTYM